jgi:hypothetical protein
MHTYYRITVKPDYRWANVRVSGRNFSKASIEDLNETEVNEEILNSPLLVVEKVEPEPEPSPEPVEGPEKPKRGGRKAKEEGDG